MSEEDTEKMASNNRRSDRPRKPRTKTDPAAQLNKSVAGVLARLPQIERDVLMRRVGLHDGHVTTIATVARDLGLATSEVADIESRAIERLQTVVGPDVARQMLAAAS